MRHVWLLSLALLTAGVYALGDGVEFDKEANFNGTATTAPNTVHTEKDTVHGETDMIHVTGNGIVQPKGITGISTLNINNQGKPFITNEGQPLVTNQGKPLMLITNEGHPLIYNEGKPLITNTGPLMSFENQGQPVFLVKVDMGPVAKTVDNSIHTLVIVLVCVIVLICGCAIIYFHRLMTNYNLVRKMDHSKVVKAD